MHDRVILEVLYATATRRTELSVLRLDHIDLSRCLLRINQGKGHKDCVVPMGERARAWLEPTATMCGRNWCAAVTRVGCSSTATAGNSAPRSCRQGSAAT